MQHLVQAPDAEPDVARDWVDVPGGPTLEDHVRAMELMAQGVHPADPPNILGDGWSITVGLSRSLRPRLADASTRPLPQVDPAGAAGELQPAAAQPDLTPVFPLSPLALLAKIRKPRPQSASGGQRTAA